VSAKTEEKKDITDISESKIDSGGAVALILGNGKETMDDVSGYIEDSLSLSI